MKIKRKLSEKGFTLVELLAVIVVLSLILSFGIYFISESISKAKEKTYETTINNIEKQAGNYLLENRNTLFYIASSDGINEYQCVTIQDLINYGYLTNNVVDSPIAKDKYVRKGDYIYIERNISSKSIVKNVYDRNNKYSSSCGSAVAAVADIALSFNPGIDEWGKSKEVTITYKLKNVYDADELSNYSYEYSYTGESTLVSDNGNVKVINLKSEGKLLAQIKYNENEFESKNEDVKKIDIVGPVIAVNNYTGSNTVSGSVTIPLKVTDAGVGVNYDSFTKSDIIVTIGDESVTDFTLTKVSESSGIYNLIINNNTLSGQLKVTIKAGSVSDKLGNTNGKKEISNFINGNIIFDNECAFCFNYTGQFKVCTGTNYATCETLENITYDKIKTTPWKVYFLTGGTLTVTKIKSKVDAFLVGGGGGYSFFKAGGGGGYTTTQTGLTLVTGNSYNITIGAGGARGEPGKSTKAFDLTANGGGAANSEVGGSGGSGGAPDAGEDTNCKSAGSNGSNGTNGETQYNQYGGTGCANNGGCKVNGSVCRNTREFCESSGAIYAGGGAGTAWIRNGFDKQCSGGAGGGGNSGQSGAANTGGGAGGCYSDDNCATNITGGSGVVIIRNNS